MRDIGSVRAVIPEIALLGVKAAAACCVKAYRACRRLSLG